MYCKIPRGFYCHRGNVNPVCVDTIRFHKDRLPPNSAPIIKATDCLTKIKNISKCINPGSFSNKPIQKFNALILRTEYKILSTLITLLPFINKEIHSYITYLALLLMVF